MQQAMLAEQQAQEGQQMVQEAGTAAEDQVMEQPM